MSTKSGIFNWSMFKSSWLTDKLWFSHLHSLPYLNISRLEKNLCLTYTCSGWIVLSLTFPSVSYFSCLPMLHKSMVRNMVAHLNNVLKSLTRIISTVFTTQMLALERSSLWTALLTQKWFANLSPLPCLHPQQMVQRLPLCAQENSWNQMECRFVLKNSVFSRRTLCLHCTWFWRLLEAQKIPPLVEQIIVILSKIIIFFKFKFVGLNGVKYELLRKNWNRYTFRLFWIWSFVVQNTCKLARNM